MSSTSIQRCFIILAGAALVLAAGVATADTIVTVPVGNVGNAWDKPVPTQENYYGRVDYQYSIGKYEVTASEYMEFLNAVAATDTYNLYHTSMDDIGTQYAGCGIQRNGSPGSYTYSLLASDWANRPVNYVSWGDAARFANWLHNGKPGLVTPVPQDQYSTERGSYELNGAWQYTDLKNVNRSGTATWVIPTEDEWYKAAYYKGGGANAGYWDFAMKSEYQMPYPSNDLTLPETPDPGNNANHYIAGDWSVGSPYYKSVVGDFENSESAYNTFDQCGNVWEWNEAKYYDGARGYRGGAYDGSRDYMAASYRAGNYASFEMQDVGFRVALVPEPGSIVLLLGAAAAGLVCWRRRK